ncbi:hypothetical protein PV783_00715 [Chitinophaga sp. CC14]
MAEAAIAGMVFAKENAFVAKIPFDMARCRIKGDWHKYEVQFFLTRD